MIRAALEDDVAVLPDIERAAGAAFREVDMAAIAEGEPLPVDELMAYQFDGRAWVAADDEDRPVAYLLLEVLDGGAHIDQVSVHPGAARQGIGSELMDTAAEWAFQRHLLALTLTTFTHVPWNAPYYARLGFRVIPTEELSPGLRRIRNHEAAIGLDWWPRVAMSRPVNLTESVH